MATTVWRIERHADALKCLQSSQQPASVYASCCRWGVAPEACLPRSTLLPAVKMFPLNFQVGVFVPQSAAAALGGGFTIVGEPSVSPSGMILICHGLEVDRIF